MNAAEFRARGLKSIRLGIYNAKKRHGIPVDEADLIVRPKMKKAYLSTEKETQAACAELLRARGIFHYRQNSGAMKTERGNFYRFGTPGAPDIVAVIQGRYVGLEIKDVAGRQSETQKLFQKQLEAAGGIYLLIRQVEELEEFLRKI